MFSFRGYVIPHYPNKDRFGVTILPYSFFFGE